MYKKGSKGWLKHFDFILLGYDLSSDRIPACLCDPS